MDPEPAERLQKKGKREIDGYLWRRRLLTLGLTFCLLVLNDLHPCPTHFGERSGQCTLPRLSRLSFQEVRQVPAEHEGWS